jgi:O-antigen/teichoic acid export membrane protein
MTEAPARRLGTNALLQFATTVFGLLSGGVVSILVARVLGPSELGSYALALIIGGGVKVLVGLGLERTALRFAAELAGQPMAAPAVWWLLVRRSGAAIGAAVVMLLAAPLIGLALHDPVLTPLLLIGAGVILLELVGSVLEAALQGASRFDLLARSAALLQPVHVCSTVLALLLDGRAIAVMAAHLLTGLVGIGLIVWLSRRAGLLVWRPAGPTPELAARMARFSRHGYWLSMLTFVVHDRVEVLVLGALTGAASVGYYSASVAAAGAAMSLGPAVVSAIFFPLLAADWAQVDRAVFAARYRQCLRYLAFAAAPLALGGIALAEAGVAVVLGPAYAPIVPVLRVTLLGVALAAVAQGPTAALAAVERQDWLLRIGGPLAALNLALDVLLVPPLGALGAAWANLAVAAGEVALLGLVAWRLAAVAPSWQSVFTLVAAGLAGLAAWLALGDRLDLTGLGLGIAAAVPVYIGVLAVARFFRAEDAEIVAPLLARVGLGRIARILQPFRAPDRSESGGSPSACSGAEL